MIIVIGQIIDNQYFLNFQLNEKPLIPSVLFYDFTVFSIKIIIINKFLFFLIKNLTNIFNNDLIVLLKMKRTRYDNVSESDK